jgi:vacuolar-type H+-ATPase subunit F/Vma7
VQRGLASINPLRLTEREASTQIRIKAMLEKLPETGVAVILIDRKLVSRLKSELEKLQ